MKKTKKDTVEPQAKHAVQAVLSSRTLGGQLFYLWENSRRLCLILCPDRAAVPKGLHDLSPLSTVLYLLALLAHILMFQKRCPCLLWSLLCHLMNMFYET